MVCGICDENCLILIGFSFSFFSVSLPIFPRLLKRSEELPQFFNFNACTSGHPRLSTFLKFTKSQNLLNSSIPFKEHETDFSLSLFFHEIPFLKGHVLLIYTM